MKIVHAIMTVLVENTSDREGVGSEHGLSFLIETQNGTLLWDTGQTGLVAENAPVLGKSLSSITRIALSHGHYDHMGGLPRVLEFAPHAHVYGHTEIFRQRYSQRDADTAVSVGSPVSREFVEERCESLHLSDGPVEILPDIFTTGEVPRVTDYEDTGGDFFLDADCTEPDLIPDDQSLYFRCSEGIVVLLGCAHSGVVNTLTYISELTGQEKVFAVLGGMHLIRASGARLEATAEAFARHDIRMIGPCHCTGEPAVTFLRSRFPDRIVDCSAGTRFNW